MGSRALWRFAEICQKGGYERAKFGIDKKRQKAKKWQIADIFDIVFNGNLWGKPPLLPRIEEPSAVQSISKVA